MPKFRISYTTEDWWRVDVEAKDVDEAMRFFYNGIYDDMAVMTEGAYLQESVDIQPLED